ncbi:hypothetical protein [Paenibacillus dendritiformis]|uniref:hypothetical protein n=1 Tax=Paenibacillus dendritiformis TaxID=130049 RepID=UPI000DA93080|nr:hypothetical protein [Paenibacillus dendritiformis]PZM62931.1 hypothetical protein DOE73_24915 [Paenibacillus dendritiformis]
MQYPLINPLRHSPIEQSFAPISHPVRKNKARQVIPLNQEDPAVQPRRYIQSETASPQIDSGCGKIKMMLWERTVMMSEQLLHTIVQELQGLNGRFDKMDKRFDQVEQRLGKVEQRLDNMDKRFDQVEQRLSKVEQRLDKMDKRFDQVEQRLNTMDSRLEAIEIEVKQANTSLAQIEQSQPSDIHSMLHIISHKIDSLTKDVEYTYHRTAQNELEINRLRNQ